MPEWLQGVIEHGDDISILALLARLILSFALGAIVAATYRWSHENNDSLAPSFITTLVLMTIVIAMSTQIIGNNVARAFSLVGALSIVRFRTVVQDTRDTVFVIFSVVVGMAVGAGHLTVALLGIVVTGIASFVMRPRQSLVEFRATKICLVVRVGVAKKPEILLANIFAQCLKSHELIATASAKQGRLLECSYLVELLPTFSKTDLVSEISLIPGVANVELRHLAQ